MSERVAIELPNLTVEVLNDGKFYTVKIYNGPKIGNMNLLYEMVHPVSGIK